MSSKLTCPKCHDTSCTRSKSGESIYCGECRERFTVGGVSIKTGKDYSKGWLGNVGEEAYYLEDGA